jgi:hypothetical protein
MVEYKAMPEILCHNCVEVKTSEGFNITEVDSYEDENDDEEVAVE